MLYEKYLYELYRVEYTEIALVRGGASKRSHLGNIS